MLFPFDEYWAKITKKEIFFCIFKNCQQVEHNTFNVGVLGSSPSWITEKKKASASQRLFSF